MIDDPVVEEIKVHRQDHAARFNYDLAAIFADLLEREKSSSRPVINRPSRRIPEKLKPDTGKKPDVLAHRQSSPPPS